MSEKSPGARPNSTAAKKKAAAEKKAAQGKTKPKKKPVDPTKAGRALRQKFTTGTVDEVAAQIRTVRAIAPMNGPGATGQGGEHPIFARFDTKFADRDVDAAFDAVRHSGVIDTVEARIAKVKKKPGRPVEFPYRALVVGMLLTAIDGKGCLCSEIARTLYYRLSPTSMRLLDLEPLPAPEDKEDAQTQQWRIEKRVRSALTRFLGTLDPSIHPTGKEMPWTKLRELDRPLTPEEIVNNHAALSVICNHVLRIPFDLLPGTVKAKYRGSACIDGTPMRLNTRGRGIDTETASTDGNAGYYGRGGDHTEDGTKTFKKVFYGYDINLMTAVCDWLGDRQFLPTLPLAMHLDAPGVDPAGAARRMFADLKESRFKPRFLAGDGLYAKADPEKFHTPARKEGWRLVLPVLDDHLGIQTSEEGLVMVEGAWYCPSIPAILVDATVDFRADDIDLATYRQRIAARVPYSARFKGTNGSGTERWGCPASGSHPATICALKPRSEEQKFIGGPVLGVRLKDRITPDPETQTGGVWPKPCRQDSVSIDLRPESHDHATLTAAAKRAEREAARFLQDLTFGTSEHTDNYNALRQAQEGFHGFAKDDAYEALGSPGRRRVRGYAAQSFFAAILLAAAGIRKVRSFLAKAKIDENGDRFVTRRKRNGEHATTHRPPGGKGTRGDPDFDADTDDPDTGAPEAA